MFHYLHKVKQEGENIKPVVELHKVNEFFPISLYGFKGRKVADSKEDANSPKEFTGEYIPKLSFFERIKYVPTEIKDTCHPINYIRHQDKLHHFPVVDLKELICDSLDELGTKEMDSDSRNILQNRDEISKSFLIESTLISVENPSNFEHIDLHNGILLHTTCAFHQ